MLHFSSFSLLLSSIILPSLSHHHFTVLTHPWQPARTYCSCWNEKSVSSAWNLIKRLNADEDQQPKVVYAACLYLLCFFFLFGLNAYSYHVRNSHDLLVSRRQEQHTHTNSKVSDVGKQRHVVCRKYLCVCFNGMRLANQPH